MAANGLDLQQMLAQRMGQQLNQNRRIDHPLQGVNQVFQSYLMGKMLKDSQSAAEAKKAATSQAIAQAVQAGNPVPWKNPDPVGLPYEIRSRKTGEVQRSGKTGTRDNTGELLDYGQVAPQPSGPSAVLSSLLRSGDPGAMDLGGKLGLEQALKPKPKERLIKYNNGGKPAFATEAEALRLGLQPWEKPTKGSAKWKTLNKDEMAASNFLPGSVVQQNEETGAFKVNFTPKGKTAEDRNGELATVALKMLEPLGTDNTQINHARELAQGGFGKEAIAMMKKNGMKISVDKDGVTFEQGGMAGAGDGAGIQKATRRKLEESMMKASQTQGQLTEILADYEPDFLTIPGKVEKYFEGVSLGWGKNLDSPEADEAYDKYTDFRASSGNLFSTMLKDLSGGAVTEPEAKRAEAWLPNPGKGIWDGDNPRQFESKARKLLYFQKMAKMRSGLILKHGFDAEKMQRQLGILNVRSGQKGFKSFKDKVGTKLYNKRIDGGMKPAEAEAAAKQDLLELLGLSR
jgi:hypothetical protein